MTAGNHPIEQAAIRRRARERQFHATRDHAVPVKIDEAEKRGGLVTYFAGRRLGGGWFQTQHRLIFRSAPA